jgi:hypothetical protein
MMRGQDLSKRDELLVFLFLAPFSLNTREEKASMFVVESKNVKVLKSTANFDVIMDS